MVKSCDIAADSKLLQMYMISLNNYFRILAFSKQCFRIHITLKRSAYAGSVQ